MRKHETAIDRQEGNENLPHAQPNPRRLAPPLKARERKPEYPLDFMIKNRKSYFRLFELIGGITVIDPAPIPEVEQAVLGHALRELSFSAPLRESGGF